MVGTVVARHPPQLEYRMHGGVGQLRRPLRRRTKHGTKWTLGWIGQNQRGQLERKAITQRRLLASRDRKRVEIVVPAKPSSESIAKSEEKPSSRRARVSPRIETIPDPHQVLELVLLAPDRQHPGVDKLEIRGYLSQTPPDGSMLNGRHTISHTVAYGT